MGVYKFNCVLIKHHNSKLINILASLFIGCDVYSYCIVFICTVINTSLTKLKLYIQLKSAIPVTCDHIFDSDNKFPGI